MNGLVFDIFGGLGHLLYRVDGLLCAREVIVSIGYDICFLDHKFDLKAINLPTNQLQRPEHLRQHQRQDEKSQLTGSLSVEHHSTEMRKQIIVFAHFKLTTPVA